MGEVTEGGAELPKFEPKGRDGGRKSRGGGVKEVKKNNRERTGGRQRRQRDANEMDEEEGFEWRSDKNRKGQEMKKRRRKRVASAR